MELAKQPSLFIIQRIWNRTEDEAENVLPLTELNAASLAGIDLVIEVCVFCIYISPNFSGRPPQHNPHVWVVDFGARGFVCGLADGFGREIDARCGPKTPQGQLAALGFCALGGVMGRRRHSTND